MNSPYRHARRVAFADTDASGLVHFTAVLRFVEEAEHALLRQLAIPLLTQSGGWPRIHVECQYEAPLFFGDEIVTSLTLARLGNSSLTWAFQIHQQKAGAENLAAKGRLTTVFVQAAGAGEPISARKPPQGIHKQSIPQPWREALATWQRS